MQKSSKSLKKNFKHFLQLFKTQHSEWWSLTIIGHVTKTVTKFELQFSSVYRALNKFRNCEKSVFHKKKMDRSVL